MLNSLKVIKKNLKRKRKSFKNKLQRYNKLQKSKRKKFRYFKLE